jgi:SAM-dependent methyltransferase
MSEPVHEPRSTPDGERYIPSASRGEFIAAEHLARYAWAAQAAKGRVSLDAGCGVGYGTAMIAHAGALQAFGVDVNADAIGDAQAYYGDVASFAVADLLALPFGKGSFTLVTCFEAIEHVADPERAMYELSRVLADDGLLLLSSPNRGVYPEGNPFHVHEYTAAELEESVRARFEYVRIHRQDLHLASLIANADAHGTHDPETEIAASVRRLEPGIEGSETYTLAVASRNSLPELPNTAMLTGALTARNWIDAVRAWARRARRAEAEAASVRRELTRERATRRNERMLAKIDREPGTNGGRLRRWRRSGARNRRVPSNGGESAGS